jgi:putative membrane protein
VPAVIAHFGPASILGVSAAAGAMLVVLLRPGGWSRRSLVTLSGLLAAMVALSPVVEHAAEHGVAPHMLQHLLLVSVAAPLIALAPPAPREVPLGPRRLMGRTILRCRRSAVPVLMVSTAAHAVVLVFWHVPGPYDAAVRSAPLHVVEHVTMLGTGVALWAAVRLNVRRNPLACGTALFLTAVVGAGLGALLTFAPEPVYELSAAAPDPLADQQMAGLLMWVPGGVVPDMVRLTAARAAPLLCRRDRTGAGAGLVPAG